MKGLSTLATLISVLSFPLIFVSLIYPHLMGIKGRWYGLFLYGGLSFGMMLVAVVTSPEPHLSNQEWTWVDWFVMLSGTGLLLFFIVKKFSSIKKQMIAKRAMGSNQKDLVHQQRRKGKRKKRKSRTS